MVVRIACNAWLCWSASRMASSSAIRAVGPFGAAAAGGPAGCCGAGFCPKTQLGRASDAMAHAIPFLMLHSSISRKREPFCYLTFLRELRTQEDYRAGGARGEILVPTVVAISICGRVISRRVAAGAIPRAGASVAIAAAAVEHTGQKCGLSLPPFRSAQKCSCANRNASANNTAYTFALFARMLIFSV